MTKKNKNTEVIERVKYVLNLKKDKDLAEFLDVKTQHISNWKKDGFPKQRLLFVAEKSKADLTWLLTGEGSPFLERKPGDPITGKNVPGGAFFHPPDLNAKPIPIIGFTAAGKGGYFDDCDNVPDFSDVQDTVTRPYDLKDITAYGLRIDKVNGDSMMPMFRPGDIVIASPVATVLNNDMVIVKLCEGEVMFKIVEFSGDNIRLYSLNPRHDSIKVSSDDICIMHKVVHIRKK